MFDFCINGAGMVGAATALGLAQLVNLLVVFLFLFFKFLLFYHLLLLHLL